MKDDATANLAEAGSDSAQPSDLPGDNFGEDFDFEEQEAPASPEVDTAEPAGKQENGEAGESGQEPEGEADSAVEQPEDKQPRELTADVDDHLVTIPGGEKVALAELRNGYMRQQDYSRKTMETANHRREVVDTAQRISRTADALAEMLVRIMPARPDDNLMFTDPQAHYAQRVQFENAEKQVHAVLLAAEEAKASTQQMTEQERREHVTRGHAAMAQALPEWGSKAGREKILNGVYAAAGKLGFSEQEVASVIDPRMLQLAHWANIGLQAEQAKAAAKQKLSGLPPVTPPRRAAQPNGSQARTNRQAMERLEQTGSFEDAMKIDFDG